MTGLLGQCATPVTVRITPHIFGTVKNQGHDSFIFVIDDCFYYYKK